MPDYSPLHKPGQTITRQTTAAVTGGQVLIVTGSGTVGPSTAATHLWVGFAAHDAASGEYVTVEKDGVQRPTASGSITAGQLVEAAAAGAVAAHTNGTNDFNVIGLALTSATNGQQVEVAPIR